MPVRVTFGNRPDGVCRLGGLGGLSPKAFLTQISSYGFTETTPAVALAHEHTARPVRTQMSTPAYMGGATFRLRTLLRAFVIMALAFSGSSRRARTNTPHTGKMAQPTCLTIGRNAHCAVRTRSRTGRQMSYTQGCPQLMMQRRGEEHHRNKHLSGRECRGRQMRDERDRVSPLPNRLRRELLLGATYGRCRHHRLYSRRCAYRPGDGDMHRRGRRTRRGYGQALDIAAIRPRPKETGGAARPGPITDCANPR